MERKNNYEIQAAQARALFCARDLDAVAREHGLRQEGQWLHLRLLGEPYRVSRRNGRIERKEDGRWLPADGFDETLTIFDLLCDAKPGRHAAGTWRTTLDFGGQVHRGLLENEKPDALELLLSFLESNGYDHVTVDLSAEGALTDVALLLIASPQKDFSDTELEEINEFAKEGGSLFITRDYTDPLDSMPNYLSLLRSYGVTPLSGIVVDPGAYHENPLAIVPYMEELDMTQSLISSGMDVLLMPAACAFETPGEPDHSLTTGTVLKTSDQAYLRDLSDGIDSVDQQPGDRSGELSVALYAHISRLFIAGSSGLFTEEYVYQRTYVQQFIIMLMGQLLSDKIVTLDIMASAAVRPALTVGSQTVGTVLIIAVPLMVLVAGLCVLLPRRNR